MVHSNGEAGKDRLLLFLCWVPYALLTARFWFTSDDAFISFRYARNLIQGEGLRYNVTETIPVEGYSNFLWVLFTSVFEAFSAQTAAWASAVGFLSGSLLLVFLYRTLRRHFAIPSTAAFLTTLGLACFPPFAVWSSGGLETMTYALAIFIAFERLALRRKNLSPMTAGAAGLAGSLLRVEGVLWALAVGMLALIRGKEDRSRSRRAFLIYNGMVLGGYAIYFLWRFAYYQRAFPNTVYAKVATNFETLLRGLKYVGIYELTFITPLLLIPACFLAIRRDHRSLWLAPAAMALSFPAFAILVSGDWMAMGRLLVPGLAFQALLMGALLKKIWNLQTKRQAYIVAFSSAAILVALLPAWNIHAVPDAVRKTLHFRHMSREFRSEFEQWKHMKEETESWSRKGKALARIATSGDSLEAGAIGAVGYYSGLHIFDRYGLISPEVSARDEKGSLRSPGHDKEVRRGFFSESRPTFVAAKLVDASESRRASIQWGLRWKQSPLMTDYVPDLYEIPASSSEHESQILLVNRRLDSDTDAADFWKEYYAKARRCDGAPFPNVLLIIWDTVRADRLGCYGYGIDTTPHLDRLAGESLLFERAVSPGMWTLPSHASLFTGLPVSAHGVGARHKWLDSRFVTLAEYLGEIGYATYAFSANPLVSAQTNLLQGFQTVEHPWDPQWRNRVRSEIEAKLIPGDRSTDLVLRRGSGGRSGSLPTSPFKECGPTVKDAFLDWLRTRDKERPFLACLNLMEAHTPRIPSLEARRQVMEEEKIQRSLKVNQSHDRLMSFMFGNTSIPDEEIAVINSVYDASIAELDRITHELIQEMRQNGVLDDTVVVLTSDHGENLGDHGLFDHKYSLHNTLVRVPLLIRFPSRTEAGRREAPVSLLGLTPAILEILDLAAPERRYPWPSLLEKVLADSTQTNRAFSQLEAATPRPMESYASTLPDFDRQKWLRTYQAVEEGDYKLLRHSNGESELFDVVKNPEETNNLADSLPDVARELSETIDRWLATVPEYDPDSASEKDTPPPLPRELGEQLRALGYVDN